jgi:hypothetical protein
VRSTNFKLLSQINENSVNNVDLFKGSQLLLQATIMIFRPGPKPPSYATASNLATPLLPNHLATSLLPDNLATPLLPNLIATSLLPDNLVTPLLPYHLAKPLLPDNLATPLLPDLLATPLLPHNLSTPLLPNHLATPHLPDTSLARCRTQDTLFTVTVTALCADTGDDDSRRDGEHSADE